MDKLRRSHVAVFGLGGVGSYAAEALCRAGIGELTLIDGDTVSLSNINRQLYALHSTVGQPKAEAAASAVSYSLNTFICPSDPWGVSCSPWGRSSAGCRPPWPETPPRPPYTPAAGSAA